jgi:hypothetical protein
MLPVIIYVQLEVDDTAKRPLRPWMISVERLIHA